MKQKVIFKNSDTFIDCRSEKNNAHVDNDLGGLWLFYRDEPVLGYYNISVSFAGNNTADLFKFFKKAKNQTSNNDKKNVEVMVPLRYLSNFWKTL